MYLALGVDVANVGSDTYSYVSDFVYIISAAAEHTGSKTDVVEGQLGHSWVELQEQRQWLTDTTGRTENGDLGRLNRLC